MKQNHFLVMILILFLLSACTSETPPPPATLTATSVPTNTPIPTPSITPSPKFFGPVNIATVLLGQDVREFRVPTLLSKDSLQAAFPEEDRFAEMVNVLTDTIRMFQLTYSVSEIRLVLPSTGLIDQIRQETDPKGSKVVITEFDSKDEIAEDMIWVALHEMDGEIGVTLWKNPVVSQDELGDQFITGNLIEVVENPDTKVKTIEGVPDEGLVGENQVVWVPGYGLTIVQTDEEGQILAVLYAKQNPSFWTWDETVADTISL